MKYATHLALASVAALAVSATANTVKTFDIGFDDYTLDAAPSNSVNNGSVDGGTWTMHDDDASYITTKSSGSSDYVLSLDAGSDKPLSFAPSASETVYVELDVQFVGASSEPSVTKANTQAVLYLLKGDSANTLKISVAGGNFVDFTGTPTVTENTWYKLAFTFDYSTPSTTVVLSDASGNTLATHTVDSVLSGATRVNAVDFYGNGLVDNFVGKPAASKQSIAVTTTDDGSTSTSDGTVTVALENGVLTPGFAATVSDKTLKFITVTGTISGQTVTRKLRVVDNGTGPQSINITACGFDSVTSILASYGDSVTATDENNPPTTSPTVSEGTVSGSVTAKSGLYYSVESNGARTALNDNNPIAPQNEGTTLNYSVEASSGPYGVVKFKIVESDDPVAE